MVSTIETYKDLLEALQKLSPEQLQQPVQVVNSSPVEEDILEGMPGIALGTVAGLEFYRFRSVVDNTYRLEDLVIFTDCNPFAVDGAISYEIDNADWENLKPHYGKGGIITIEMQTCPTERTTDLPVSEVKVLTKRIQKHISTDQHD